MLANHRNRVANGAAKRHVTLETAVETPVQAPVLASQAGARPTPSAGSSTPLLVADPQVSSGSPRRHFSTSYKLAVLAEAQQCTGRGQIGALLRREGLYASGLAAFRRQQAEGRLVLRAAPQGRAARRSQAAQRQQQARRLAQLERDNQRLRALLEAQKKLSELLGLALGADEENSAGENTKPPSTSRRRA